MSFQGAGMEKRVSHWGGGVVSTAAVFYVSPPKVPQRRREGFQA